MRLKALGFLLPLVAGVAGLALLLADPVFLQTLRNQSFDQYQRWHPRPFAATPVRIIDLDEESLARLGQWPWPRTHLARLVDRLEDAGAAAIGFDVVFAEPDRTTPAAMAELWSLSGELRTAVEALPDHDAAFAGRLAEAPVVLGFALERGAAAGPGSVPEARLPARPFRAIQSGKPALHWLHQFDRAIPALPALEASAAGNGALSFVPDRDGVVRRVPLMLALDQTMLPTLVTEVLRVGQGERNVLVKAAEGGDAGLEAIRIGEFAIPTNPHGELWVHDSGPVAERYLPAWRVLAGAFPSALVEGHLVLVGASAQGLMDLRFSPSGRIVPGVEMHAQALEQILSGQRLQRPSWARGLEALTIVAGSLFVGLFVHALRIPLATFFTAVLLGTLLVGGWQAFRTHGLLLDTLTPALVLAAAFLAGSIARHVASERDERWIREAFARYVSPNRVAHLVSHPESMQLGGERRQCSFVFTDLASFTRLMETLDPGCAVALLNGYLDGMIAIAFRHEGTLDRIVGDAVAILFSAPIVQPDHSARALACALEMDAFGARYAARLQAEGIPFGDTRIGVHAGEVIVGNFGGANVFDYRALGDPVNTASRLEGANKYLGTRICASEAVIRACADSIPHRPIGRLLLQGKSRPVPVFEPFDPTSAERNDAPLDAYLPAYEAMVRETTTPPADGTPSPALQAFSRLAAHFPDDPLVRLHHQRLTRGEHGDLIVLDGK